MMEDTLPAYIKENKKAEIRKGDKPFQYSMYYFKARVTLKLPLENLAYMPLGDYKIQGHYLFLDGKKLYLFPIFNGFVEECIDFIPTK